VSGKRDQSGQECTLGVTTRQPAPLGAGANSRSASQARPGERRRSAAGHGPPRCRAATGSPTARDCAVDLVTELVVADGKEDWRRTMPLVLPAGATAPTEPTPTVLAALRLEARPSPPAFPEPGAVQRLRQRAHRVSRRCHRPVRAGWRLARAWQDSPAARRKGTGD